MVQVLLLLVHVSELQPAGTCRRAGLVLLFSPWFIWLLTQVCGKQPHRVKFTSAYNHGISMAAGTRTLVNRDFTRTKRWADRLIVPQVCCTSFKGPYPSYTSASPGSPSTVLDQALLSSALSIAPIYALKTTAEFPEMLGPCSPLTGNGCCWVQHIWGEFAYMVL